MKFYNVNTPKELRELADQLQKTVSVLAEAKRGLLDTLVSDVEMDFQSWLDFGVRMGFCEEIHCMSHEAPVLTKEENDDLEAGCDVCVPLMRVYLEGDSPCSSI